MDENVKLQLKALYAQTRDKDFVNKLILICNIFSVSKVSLIK